MMIRVKPFDTLFFRDGKPFSMGDEVWASGLFPPPPSVIYGALRTAYFAEHPEEITKANEENDPTQNLVIKMLSVAIGDTMYFPVGQDLLVKKDTQQREQYLSYPAPTTINSSSPFHGKQVQQSYLLTPGTTAFLESPQSGSLIAADDLADYLTPDSQQGLDLFNLKQPSEYLSADPKTGIGRSAKTGSAEEGLLYRVEMLRMATKKQTDISLIVEFEGLDIPSGGMLKLGGEGKAATYKQVEASTLDYELPDAKLTGQLFKLYLATPAIFGQGWLPGGIDPNTLEGKINGVSLRLIGASLDKPAYRGGFNIKARRFKPMKRSVNAGAVYFCELIEDATPTQAKDAIHGKSISDEKRAEGYGVAFLGTLPNQ